MKRRALEKHLNKHGCHFLREGRNHTIFVNPIEHRTYAEIPRHREVKKSTVFLICKSLKIPKPSSAA